MNKKLLIFTGVGDNEDQYLSWARESNSSFDRAINYYGNDKIRSISIQKNNPEYFFQNSGMIWENFYKNFDKFKGYQYFLIVDSDLLLNPYDIKNHLDYVLKHNVHGSTWSRSKDSYGYFTPLFLPKNNNKEAYYSNWIEMCFMMLSSELTHKTVKKWSELNLSWSTGIDFVVANTALWNEMLPFHILNKFQFRNIPPSEKKNGREIDHITQTDTKQRLARIFELMEKDSFFHLKAKDISTWED